MLFRFVLLIAFSLLTSIAIAAPGDLDSSFGTGGKVAFSSPGFPGTARAVSILPDGKIVVAGGVVDPTFGTNNFNLMRFHPTGLPDSPSFGAGGQVWTDFGFGSEIAAGLVVQPDGKLLAAGYMTNGVSAARNFALARYSGTNGALDATFGTNGKVTTNFTPASHSPGTGVALQPDGKIVVGGYTGNPENFALARYLSTGSLDTSFSTGGIVVTDYATFADIAFSILVQSDGKIVLAGRTDKGTFGSLNFLLARYNSNGTLDTGFGTGGFVETDFAAGNDAANAIAQQADGKLVVAGNATVAGKSLFAVARYGSDGALDGGFGAAGKVTTDIALSGGTAYAIAFQPDGKIIVSGVAFGASFRRDFALVRYLPGGGLDSTFGVGGIVLVDGSATATGIAYSVAIQADGKIVAAGESWVMRFEGVPAHTLTVAKSGAGAGTVASVPSGINCGAACALDFAEGTSVTLSATAAFGSVFAGWSGCDSVNATNQCVIAMSAPKSVSATFDQVPLALSGVVSRKTHGAAGTFDLPIDTALVSPAITVESRAIGAGHQIVFQFNGPVTSVGGATAADAGNNPLTANPAFAGNEVTVTLADVPDNRRVTIALTGVNGALGANTAIGFLLGDVNGSRELNSTDFVALKARSGQSADAGNFGFDLGASGAITAADIAALKARPAQVLQAP